MPQKMSNDEIFLDSKCFSNEATFYLNDIINKHNQRIWVSQPPEETVPFFSFKKQQWQNHPYLDMLEHHSVTTTLWFKAQAGWSTPIFYKYYTTVFKLTPSR
jgi:hypothetical protein